MTVAVRVWIHENTSCKYIVIDIGVIAKYVVKQVGRYKARRVRSRSYRFKSWSFKADGNSVSPQQVVGCISIVPIAVHCNFALLCLHAYMLLKVLLLNRQAEATLNSIESLLVAFLVCHAVFVI